MKKPWKTYFSFILLAEVTGLLSAWLSRSGMAAYGDTIVASPLSPPPIVFVIVWTILYALMGIGAARIWMTDPSKARTSALWIFGIQLVFNFFWSILFFRFQSFDYAFFWLLALWVLILRMIQVFRPLDRLASNLQIPYLLWVTFAAYLNYSVWQLN